MLESFLPSLAGFRLIRSPFARTASRMKWTESGGYRITQNHKAGHSQALSHYYFIIRPDAPSIATCSEEAEDSARFYDRSEALAYRPARQESWRKAT